MEMTESEFMEAEECHQGYCTNCEDWTHDCSEPDAENYQCPVCNLMTVQGTMYVLLNELVEIVED